MRQSIWKKWRREGVTSTGLIGSLLNILYLLYYWIMVAYYLIDPIDAYDINMKIEKHAFETYVKYGAYHPEDTKIQEIAQDEYEHSKELQKAMLMIA